MLCQKKKQELRRRITVKGEIGETYMFDARFKTHQTLARSLALSPLFKSTILPFIVVELEYSLRLFCFGRFFSFGHHSVIDSFLMVRLDFVYQSFSVSKIKQNEKPTGETSKTEIKSHSKFIALLNDSSASNLI